MKETSSVNRTKFFISIAYFNICFIWGINNLVMKVGVSNLHPFQFAGMRFLLAGIILMVITYMTKQKICFSFAELCRLGAIGAIMFTFTNTCVVYANTMLDSGLVTVLLSTIPIFMTGFELCINKFRGINIRTVIGLMIGFIGIIVTVLWGAKSIHYNCMGVIFSISAAILWSIGSIYSKHLKIEGSVISQTAVKTIFASVMLLGAAIATDHFSVVNITRSSIYSIIFLALFDSVIGFVSYTFLLKNWDASKTSTYAYINPVVALIFGYLVLNEKITLSKIVGMFIILIGVLLIQHNKKTK